MTAITLKDIPKKLHDQVRKRAKENRRSMNQQMLWDLEQYYHHIAEQQRINKAYES